MRNFYKGLFTSNFFKAVWLKPLVVFLFLGAFTNYSFGAVTIGTASGGTLLSTKLAADGCATAYTTLGNVVITEGSASDFPTGLTAGTLTLVLAAPAGWNFNTVNPTLSYVAAKDITAATVTSTTATAITISINIRACGGLNPAALNGDALTITGIQVKATNKNWSAAGNITASNNGGIVGITANTTSLGSLSQRVIANAGSDQVFCAPTTATLAGNTPDGGNTGLWTVVSGTATITTPASPTSGVTGLVAGTATLRWTITDVTNGCANTSDDVILTKESGAPTTSNAGPDQYIPGNGTTATMAGNTPTVGTGTWTLVSGSGTITTPNSPSSGITGLGVGLNTFRWSITNSCGPTSTDDVVLYRYCAPSAGSTSWYITNVTFAGINNPSGAAAYTSYSATASVNAGCTFPITITESSTNDYIAVFIDYNQDGDFADAGEYVFNGTNTTGTYSGNIAIPALSGSVLAGTTRMRVIQNSSSVGSGASCTNPGTGEVEDYLIDISVASGAPADPTASAGSGATCNSFAANWSSVSGATNYYLDVSTSNSFGSFVAGFNNLSVGNVTTYSVTGLSSNTTYYYRVRASNCSGSPSGNSGTITIATTGVCYCSPAAAGETNSSFHITNVTFNTINNTTGAETACYGDYTSQSTNVTPSSTYTLSVRVDYSTFQLSAFFDWNVDGDFNDAGESVVLSNNTTSGANQTASITVPATASGNIRMRIVLSNGAPVSCNNPTWGESEDYTLSACSGGASAPSAPTANASSGATCSSFTANWSAVASVTGYYIDVATDNAFTNILSGYNNFNVGNVTNYSISGLGFSTTYYYRVRSYTACGGSSTNSGTQSGTTLAGTAKTWLTSGTTDWNTAANWNPAGVPSACTDVTIPSGGSQPVINSGSTGICGGLTINSGATLTVGSGGVGLTVNGTLTNNGTINYSGTGSLNIGNMVANNGSNFNKSNTGTLTITSATFGATSNMNFTKGASQWDPKFNYGNLTFNDITSTPSLGTTYPLRVQGNLTIVALGPTGGAAASNVFALSTSASLTHTIGGNLYLNSTSNADVMIVDNGSGSPVLNVGGDVTFASNSLCMFWINNSTSGTPTMNITGDLNMNGANVNPGGSLFGGSLNTGNTTLNISGDINANGYGAVHFASDNFCVGCLIGSTTATIDGSIIVAASIGHVDIGYSYLGGASTIYIGGSATVGAGGVFAGPHGKDKGDAMASTLIFKSPASGTATGNFSMSQGEYGDEVGALGTNARIGSGFFNVEIQANRVITLQSDIEIGNNRTFTVDAGATLITGLPGGTAYKIARRNSSNYGLSTGTTFTLSGTSGGLFATIDANSTDAAGALQATAYAGNVQTTNRTYSSTANYKFSATAAQLTGNFSTVTTPTANTVNKLIVNNTNATITTGLALTNPVTITSDLEFVAGRLQTTTTNLPTIDVGGTSSGSLRLASNTAYVDGPLAKKSNSTTKFMFPTGHSANGGRYRPVELTPSSSTAVTYRSQLWNTPTNTTYPTANVLAPVVWVEPNFYWDVIRTSATNVDAVVALYYDNPDTVSTYNRTNVGQYLSAKWTDEGGILGPASPFRSTASTSAVTTIPTAVGSNPFTLVAYAVVLPIELLSFTGSQMEKGIELQWTTATEKNTNNFIVEKSFNGVDFFAIGKVKASGNSLIAKTYSFIDSVKSKGIVYYRLRQNDLDGKFQMSNVISLSSVILSKNDVKIYFESNKSFLKIDFAQSSLTDDCQIEITDMLGKQIYSDQFSLKNKRTLSIPTDKFSSGVYFIGIVNGLNKLNQKIVY